MSEESREIIQHATTGPIKGLRKLPGVIQYLGVQYATLKDRFARGELLQSYPPTHPNMQAGVLDATKLGYEASVPIPQSITISVKDDRPTNRPGPGHFQLVPRMVVSGSRPCFNIRFRSANIPSLIRNA